MQTLLSGAAAESRLRFWMWGAWIDRKAEAIDYLRNVLPGVIQAELATAGEA